VEGIAWEVKGNEDEGDLRQECSLSGMMQNVDGIRARCLNALHLLSNEVVTCSTVKLMIEILERKSERLC
jgi:hypothetical protein